MTRARGPSHMAKSTTAAPVPQASGDPSGPTPVLFADQTPTSSRRNRGVRADTDGLSPVFCGASMLNDAMTKIVCMTTVYRNRRWY